MNLNFTNYIDSNEFFNNLYYEMFGKLPSLYRTRLIGINKDFVDKYKEYFLFSEINTHKFGGSSLSKIGHEYDLVVLKYSSCIVRTYVREENSLFEVYYSSDNDLLTVKTDIINNYKVYLPEKESGNIGIILRAASGQLYVNSIAINYDSKDFNYQYNDDFINDVSPKIIKDINDNNKTGLYLFHGIQGSGKTSYIKHILNSTSKQSLFLSSSLLDVIGDPSFLTFLSEYKNSIIIIEDAEKALFKRSEYRDGTITSNILNLTSGFFGDFLKCQVIATFNCNIDEIDPALLRSGRLISEYDFGYLTVEKSNELLKSIGIEETVNEEMLLCDIYNFEQYKLNKLNTNPETKIGYDL